MKYVSRRDIRSALITGLTTGVSAWGILTYLGHRLPLGISPSILILVVPVLWVAGVQLGYVLGALYRPFEQFGKFVAIGFANAAVDFGVLYLLIGFTGLAAGIAYSVFKTISFSTATIHSYLWNKYWAFNAGRSAMSGREIVSFLTVSVISLIINVAVASSVLAFRPAAFALQSWAGIAAIAGSAVALIVSFLGFRMFVFQKKA